MTTEIDAPIEELAETAAIKLLSKWAEDADGFELCDQLYELADQAGRADICKYLEFDDKGYAEEVRSALKTVLGRLAGAA
jgi:hypothetical protein